MKFFLRIFLREMLQILEECCKFATDMKEITMIKRQRGGEVLRTLEMETVVDMMRQGEYQKEVDLLRTYYG